VPCRGGVPPLDAKAVAELLKQVDAWQLVGNHHLSKTYKLVDYRQALAFVNRIAAMAEEQNHHPDLYLAWGRVRVDVWTHKVEGLTESDFIFAAKCDALRPANADA
jgi:4a-hydroxytetrahydrobiopterin dehydratase